MLWLPGCAHRDAITGAQNSVAAEFVGSTPADPLAREFLGGLASNTPCHSIKWQLTLLTNLSTEGSATFNLAALYRVPTHSNSNRSEDGPKVSLHGTWDLGKGAMSRPEAAVYRINVETPQRSLSFVRLSEGLLHLVNPDGSLAIGNGGESYTLNRADLSEKPGDMALAMSAPEISYRISPLSTGVTVFAVFEGRTPCHGIARELKIPQHGGCIKAKWRVTLFRNPETLGPTIYKVEGSLFRENAREGTWSVTRGAATDPNATVYQLNPTQTQPALLLWKGDANVLFFLNQAREPLIGHADFSYTLNRVPAK